MFMIRRFIFALILVPGVLLTSFTRSLIFFAIVSLNLMNLSWIVKTRRFEVKSMERIEAFNEYMNLSISILIMVMSAITDGMTLIKFGLLLMASVGFLFAVNTLFVTCNVLGEFFKNCKKGRD